MGFSRDQHNGNLVIIFNVKFPDKLTEETLEQLKKIDFQKKQLKDNTVLYIVKETLSQITPYSN